MPDVAAALARFGAALTVQQATLRRINESAGKLGAAFSRFAAQLTIPPHAFTPDYDLNCRRCPRSAEEH
jgi:hypothetical protein